MRKQIALDFVIYKLTNSIENVVTGDSFSTDITLISISDLKTVTQKSGWHLTGNTNLSNPKEMFTN